MLNDWSIRGETNILCENTNKNTKTYIYRLIGIEGRVFMNGTGAGVQTHVKSYQRLK